MKIKLLPALLLRRELLVPMCALLATGMKADGALATGVSGSWKAFALSGTKDSFQMSGNAMVLGDVAVAKANYNDCDDDDDDGDDNSHNIGTGALRTFKLTGNSMVTGKLAFDTNASGLVNGNAVVNGGYQSNWATNISLINQANAAKAQALYYCGLSSTMGPNKVKTSSNLTLSGTSGLNVMNFSELTLSGNAMLTLAGTATSQFVVNVSNKFSLSGNSKIILSGGVDPLNVIFNYKGSKATMSGTTSLNGILMAVNGEVQLSGNAIVKGQVIAGRIKLSGNAKIVSP